MERPIKIEKLTNYFSIHGYLKRFKKGICEKCNRVGMTHLAKKHGKEHERKIENYFELCPKCHLAYDKTEDRVKQWISSLSKTPTHRNKVSLVGCKICKKMYKPKKVTSTCCSKGCASKWRWANGVPIGRKRRSFCQNTPSVQPDVV